MPDVYVTELYGIAPKHYVVMVDGKVFDTLRQYAKPHLTHSQMYDIAQGYAEVLEWYVPVRLRNH